ncbi:MAG: tRNA (N6-isopentenyl adenosine(37)-C2)-methylthiotransferase MiaB [Firmicutes bacterium]|nr:tRNA (N6-isopentenyl adenosine(37)-C2)-methylthiotransferase MiaB [Bacillota bacterium]
MASNISVNIPHEELERQRSFAECAAPILTARFGRRPVAFVHTFGCQQNVSDGERIKGMLSQMGFCFADSADDADLILFNTCAVREHAEDRVFGNVGALKAHRRRRPNCIIALCGCMVQQPQIAQKIERSYGYVNLLFGTHSIHRLPEFIYRLVSGEKRVFDISGDDTIAEGLPVRRDGSFKGWLPIMYGCNNFCTYCIVPYVRGRERSRLPEDILREAREMIDAGFKDITLLGQNVNSYGKGEAHGVDFPKLLRMINDIDGDFQIRFMTSHPKDCTVELLDAMRDCKKVCRHLHLPFQSGSDRILSQMNRRYDRQTYLSLISAARERMPDISLTSDVIVGFPGETYDDFKETLSLVDEVKFTSLFTFIYSPREGTPAAKMPDPVTHRQKAEWMAELLKLQEGIAAERNGALVGTTARVLCEEINDGGMVFGRTGGNVGIEFAGTADAVGHFATVKIISATNWILTGEQINLEE